MKKMNSLLIILFLFFSIHCVFSIVERDPTFQAQDGISLLSEPLIRQYCPTCQANQGCCHSLLQQNNYQCVALPSSSSLNPNLCSAVGRTCTSDISSPNFNFLCHTAYIHDVTCNVIDRPISPSIPQIPSRCFYRNNMREALPRCLNGLAVCSSPQQTRLLDPYVFGIFLLFELFVFVLLIWRIWFQPLKARNALITFIQYFLGLTLGISFSWLYSVYPCPLLMLCVLVGYPLYLYSEVARVSFLHALWHKNTLKGNALKTINANKGNLQLQTFYACNYSDNPTSLLEAQAAETSSSISSMNPGMSPEPTSAISLEESHSTASLLQDSNASLHVKHLKRLKRKSAIYSIIGNTCCVLTGYIIVSFLLTVVWAAVMIGYSPISANNLPGTINYWTSGVCPINETVAAIVGVESLILLVVLIGYTLAIRRVRDAYFLRLTSILDLLFSIAFVVIAIVFLVLEVYVISWVLGADNTIISLTAIVCVWIAASHATQILIPALLSFCWKKKLSAGNSKDLQDVTTFLYDEKLFKLFKAYCKREMSLENPLFWKQVEIYRSIDNFNQRKLMAYIIYDTFIKRRAVSELNIENSKRDLIAKNLENAPKDLFDPTQREIIVLMNDSFGRFCRTFAYLRLRRREAAEKQFYVAEGIQESANQPSIAEAES